MSSGRGQKLSPPRLSRVRWSSVTPASKLPSYCPYPSRIVRLSEKELGVSLFGQAQLNLNCAVASNRVFDMSALRYLVTESMYRRT